MIFGITGQPPCDQVCVKTTEPRAAAAVSPSIGPALWERAGLLEGMRLGLARTKAWLQAGKYVAALAGGAAAGERVEYRPGMPGTCGRTGRSGC